MEVKNKMGEFAIAKISETEEKEIRELEQKLGDKYYLIAFERTRS